MEDGVEISNLSIPIAKGDKGDAGKISSLVITMLESNATPTVINNGTVYDARYVLGIPRGKSIASTNINVNGELVITFDDETEITVGEVVGTSVANMYVDENSDLIVELTDSTELIVGNLSTILAPALENYYTKSEVYNKDEIDESLSNMFTVIKEHSARSLSLYLNTSTYVLTVSLNDWNGATLDTKTVDLPLETMVVSGAYDDTTKKVILTLQGGSTVEFSVADLVAGLQTEITSNNKLSADLVDDTYSTHKFITSQERLAWNQKIGASSYATDSRGGTIVTSDTYATRCHPTSGLLSSETVTYENYTSAHNYMFISKGTLENVLNVRIGDISTALDLINGEVI